LRQLFLYLTKPFLRLRPLLSAQIVDRSYNLEPAFVRIADSQRRTDQPKFPSLKGTLRPRLRRLKLRNQFFQPQSAPSKQMI
jgi:hypothetical protein